MTLAPRFRLGLALATLPLLSFSQTARRPIKLEDMHAFHDVRDPQISPDGQWVAYTVTTVDTAADKSDTDVWMASWDGTRQLRMTTSPDAENAPRWSPDGRYLAFLSGGQGAVPKPIVIDRYKFKQDVVGYLTQKPARLYVYDIPSKKAEAITPEGLEVGPPSWSPDGRQIAFMGKQGKDAERYNTWNIYAMDAAAGAAPRQITKYDGIHASAGRGRPDWSRDGARLVYTQSSGAKLSAYNMNRLAVVAVAGGEPKILAESLDRGVAAPRFTQDGKSILFLVADDRWEYPALVPAAGGQVERLTKGPGVISTVEQAKDGRFVMLAASDEAHGEIYAFDNGKLRAITHQNDALMAQLKLGATEEFTCKAKDGNEVHGLITKPVDYQPGKKYPTLLRIHGGPNGQDAHSFNFERQFFAANGFVVVNVNYRGSSGRGEKYQTAIAADWGNKEVLDLQAAMDYVVASGLADPDKLGVGGWSYGGILTDAIIAKDQRFKAAISGAGTALPLALYGVDQYIMQYDEEIGPPWKVGLEPWEKISYAFLHADRIHTPTLFMGGEKDFNVPLVGGEQMYQALASLGVPTELVIYPNSFHGITRPSYQTDRMQRYLAWYKKYLD